MSDSVSKIKVLLLYIVYPMALATYFKKALEHREDVDLKVCGPYTSNWMPWLSGVEVPAKYAISPHIPLPFPPNVGEVNYEMVQAQLGDWKPDIVINVDAGIHWKNKPNTGMVVTVGTDPHVLNEWYDAPRKYSDKFFNMQLCYSKSGDVYLPYAYSQYDHYPTIELPDATLGGIPAYKDTDAVLIGMPYSQREEWKRELENKGISVILENGPVFDEARTLYNRGHIGLNWSSMDDLNARAFEIPAMRLAPVMNLVPDIGRFFEQGIHYRGFTSLHDAVKEVVWLKEHPVECKTMADEAYKNIQGQTYDSRIEQIFRECGF